MVIHMAKSKGTSKRITEHTKKREEETMENENRDKREKESFLCLVFCI